MKLRKPRTFGLSYRRERARVIRWALLAGSLAFAATMHGQAQSDGLHADSASSPRAEDAVPVRPNYELAARFMPEKISKLIFDTSVTPHWFETSDRFWYSYQTT